MILEELNCDSPGGMEPDSQSAGILPRGEDAMDIRAQDREQLRWITGLTEDGAQFSDFEQSISGYSSLIWSQVYLLRQLESLASWKVQRLRDLRPSPDFRRRLQISWTEEAVRYAVGDRHRRGDSKDSRDRECGREVASFLSECNLLHPQFVALVLDAFLKPHVDDGEAAESGFKIIDLHLSTLLNSESATLNRERDAPIFEFRMEGIDRRDNESRSEYAERARVELDLQLEEYFDTVAPKAESSSRAPIFLESQSEPVRLSPRSADLKCFDVWILSQVPLEDGPRRTNQQVWAAAKLKEVAKQEQLVKKIVAQVGRWIGVKPLPGVPGRRWPKDRRLRRRSIS